MDRMSFNSSISGTFGKDTPRGHPFFYYPLHLAASTTALSERAKLFSLLAYSDRTGEPAIIGRRRRNKVRHLFSWAVGPLIEHSVSVSAKQC